MPISLTCPCGKKLQVRDEAAGKKVKCPGCGEILEIPAPEIDLLEVKPSGPAGRICPQCRAESPAGSALCTGCGNVFEDETVPALPLARPAVLSTEKPFQKRPPFVLMVLGMVYRPWFVLEYFRGWADRPLVLAQIVLLYLVSLAALGWVAAAGYSGPRQTEEVPSQPQIPPPGAGGQSVKVILWKTLPERMGIEAQAIPEFPEAGRQFTIRVRVNREGKLLPVRITGSVKQSPYDEDGEPTSVGELSLESDSTGWQVARYTPREPGVYYFDFRTEPPYGDEPHNGALEVRPAREIAASAGPKVIAGGTRILYVLLVSLISLALDALTINLASRILGEGGEFLFLTIVLAFVQSIVNLARLGLLAIGGLGDAHATFLFGYVFNFWELLLLLLAIMKVYEFDFRSAILTTSVAGVIKIWGAAFLVGMILSV